MFVKRDSFISLIKALQSTLLLPAVFQQNMDHMSESVHSTRNSIFFSKSCKKYIMFANKILQKM